MAKVKGKAYKMMSLAANRFSVDHSYQRDVLPSRVKHIAEDLDLDALGVFAISLRPGDVYVLLDGQHRWQAMMHHGVGEWEVLCRVYSGLTVDEEAALYRQLNDTRRISAWDDFKAGVVSEDEECLDILRIAKRAGWVVGNQAKDGMVACIAMLRTLYRREGGAKALGRALEDARQAWGENHVGAERYILAGLHKIHSTYNGDLDRPAFIAKIAKAKGGPAGILGTAKAMQAMSAKHVGALCAAVMVEHYNRGRRDGKLAEL